MLTDPGWSRSYGLDSPVFGPEPVRPRIVLYSHHDQDHDRGEEFPGAEVVDGRDLALDGLRIQAVPVSESRPADNRGYVLTYHGFTVFFAGDAQGDMRALSAEAAPRRPAALPPRIDLLLAPIDWRTRIVPEAVRYVELLAPARLVPMHYWSPATRSAFLAALRAGGAPHRIVETGGPEAVLTGGGGSAAAAGGIEVIALDPAPPGR